MRGYLLLSLLFIAACNSQHAADKPKAKKMINLYGWWHNIDQQAAYPALHLSDTISALTLQEYFCYGKYEIRNKHLIYHDTTCDHVTYSSRILYATDQVLCLDTFFILQPDGRLAPYEQNPMWHDGRQLFIKHIPDKDALKFILYPSR